MTMYNLQPVQKEAIKKSQGKNAYGFFMEQGLGKTLSALHEFNKSDCSTMMIFCTPALMSVWKDEIEKWGFDFDVIYKPTYKFVAKKPTVLIYNYESIIAAPGKYIEDILIKNSCYGAFDESIQIKNFKSARWRKIKEWRDELEVTRCLTGRPQVQSPLDLWTQLRMCGGNVNKSPYAFRGKYCKMGGYMNKQIVGANNKEELGQIMGEVSFQAKKKDWGLNIPKLWTSREFEMTQEQKKYYISMFENLFVKTREEEIISVEQAVHRTMKLQQITSGFIYNERKEPVWLVENKSNPKLQLLKDCIEQTDGKIIIFAHFKPTIKMLTQELGGLYVDSGMNPDEHAKIRSEFNGNDNLKTIVCNISATKYGWTLLGTEKSPCYTSIFYENNYSLDARVQAEDRNHRWGQKYDVLYIDLFGSKVEKAIVNRLREKLELSDMIMDLAREWSSNQII